MIATAILCILIIIFLIWVKYVSFNSYEIILKGLKRAYFLWLIQLFALTLQALRLVVRPIWQPSVASWIHDNNTICAIWAKCIVSIMSLSSFVVTLFAYEKVKTYFQNSSTCLVNSFAVFIWLGAVSYIAVIIALDTGPMVVDGRNVCAKWVPLTSVIYRSCAAHYIIAHLTMICIFCRNVGLDVEVFPSLTHEVWINTRLVPIMPISKIICAAIAQVTTQNWGWWGNFIGAIVFFIDGLLSNMIMHYTLFGYKNSIEKDNEIKARVAQTVALYHQDSSDLIVETGDPNVQNNSYWVDLPGAHPILITHNLVMEHDLWEYVITDERMLRQISHMQAGRFIPSLLVTCTSSTELMETLDRMENERTELAVRNENDFPSNEEFETSSKPTSTKPPVE